jgi:hypothetical protein
MTAKQFLEKIRGLGIHPKLHESKNFVIYDPPLPTELIKTAIDLGDDILVILDSESILLSEEDKNIIESMIDANDEDTPTGFMLTAPTPETSQVIVYEDMTPESFDKDFDYIRGNLKAIIASGQKALDRMIAVALESQHPRAYEVVATLMKSLADINKDLMKTHREKHDQDKDAGVTQTTKTTNVQNNTVFVGSTADLSKFLKNRPKE